METITAQTKIVDLKSQNRNRIYQLIARRGQLSKADIAAELGLSLPTITQNLRALREMGLIHEEGVYESTGGRRARIISCNPGARVAVGLNITRGHVAIVLVDLMGTVLDGKRVRYSYEDSSPYYENLREMIEEILRANQVADQRVLGVGISLPAIVDGDGRTLTSTLVLPFPKALYEKLGPYIRFPYTFYNDANSGGYAESWSRRPGRDLFYLSLSGTVGGMFLLHDRIYEGEDFRAAEVGHTTLIPDGLMCYCGKKGCMDSYCSSNNLSQLTGGDLGRFFQEVRGKNPAFLKKWNEYLYYLSVAVNNIRMLLDCDVVLGGYVGSYMEPYLEELRSLLRERDSFSRGASYVRVCRHNTQAAAVGAGLMYVDQFLRTVS